MAGELTLTQVRVAKQTVIGTPVTPATRKLYLTEPVVGDEGESEFQRYATGTTDNVRSLTTPVRMVRAKASMEASADELVEFLLTGVLGGETPSVPSGGTLAQDWVFPVGSAVDAMTMEWDDGARAWQGIGVQVEEFEFAGDVDGAHMVNLSLLGVDFIQSALTGSPADRVPAILKGWETRMYLGAFGTDPATLDPTVDFLQKWSVKGKRNAAPKFLANNSKVPTALPLGEFDLTFELTVEGANAAALTAFNDWRAGTKKVVRLEFGTNEQIESSPTNEVQTLTEGTAMTAGTYTLTFRGQTTTALAYSATAAQIQVALEALRTIGRGNVTVTGGGVDTAPATITFVGQLAGMNVPQLTSNQGSLTGTFTHTTSTPGVGMKKTIWLDIPFGYRNVSMGESHANTRMYKLAGNAVYDPTLGYSFRPTLRNGRAAAW